MNLKKVKDILGLTMVFAVLVSNNIVMASTSDISNFGQASKASTIINSLKNGNDYEGGGRLTNNLLNINNRISDKLEVHVKNDSWNGAPNIYVYTGDGNTAVKYAGNWPGAAMTAEGDGWYTYKTDKIASGKVIFNGSWGKYPGANQAGIELSGEVWMLNNTIVENPNKNIKTVEENNSKIVYSGAWEEKVNSSYSNSTEKYAYEAGANLSFTFKGDGIRILSTLASNKGVAKVFIDGEVYSADMFNDVIEYKGVAFEKTDLTNSVHTVYIEYTGLYGFDSTAATISIDAFEIFNGDIL